MTSNGPRSATLSDGQSSRPSLAGAVARLAGLHAWKRRPSAWAPRALTCAVLVLMGAVAGLAAGQAMAQRAAHRAGACSALNMAAALGYLDAEQQRRIRHALATAINPDADLFSGGGTSLHETCGAGAGR